MVTPFFSTVGVGASMACLSSLWLSGCGGEATQPRAPSAEVSDSNVAAVDARDEDSDVAEPVGIEATGSDSAEETRTGAEAPRQLEPAEVTFTYQRRKIVACGIVNDEEGRRCDATSFTEDPAKAELTLLPIDKNDEPDSSRDEQKLQFVEQGGTQTQTVQLRKGRWELTWVGVSTARDRFFVVPKDIFDVALEAVVGACSDESGSCKLEGGKLQQIIELPEPRGAH